MLSYYREKGLLVKVCHYMTVKSKGELAGGEHNGGRGGGGGGEWHKSLNILTFRGIAHHESWVAGDHTLEEDVGNRAYNPAGVENEGGMEGDHDRSIDHHKEEGREADAENAPAPVGMAAVLVHLPAQKTKK